MGRGVDDITFRELGLAILVAIWSLCTTGPVVLALTLVKSPFVFVGVLLTCIVHALNALRSAARNLGAWAVIPLAAICVGFCIVVPCLLLGIMLSALAKVAASALWPAYVACGWLRLAGAHRQHRRPITVVLREACQAAYQVVWAADIVT